MRVSLKDGSRWVHRKQVDLNKSLSQEIAYKPSDASAESDRNTQNNELLRYGRVVPILVAISIDDNPFALKQKSSIGELMSAKKIQPLSLNLFLIEHFYIVFRSCYI